MFRTFLSVARRSIERFLAERGTEAAAGLGFYAVFSLFPFLLLLVAAASTALKDPDIQSRILDAALRLMPISGEFVGQNIERIMSSRVTFGVVGTVMLTWAATSAFAVFSLNVNRAWTHFRPVAILRARVAALAVVGLLVAASSLVILGGGSAAGAVSRLATDWGLDGAALPLVPLRLLVPAVGFIALLLFYRLIPAVRVLWREAAIGSLTAVVLLWAGTRFFALFLQSGVVRYSVIYGSLGALIALMTWIYMASLITILGAHVASAVAHSTRLSSEIALSEVEEGADGTEGSPGPDGMECSPASEGEKP